MVMRAAYQQASIRHIHRPPGPLKCLVLEGRSGEELQHLPQCFDCYLLIKGMSEELWIDDRVVVWVRGLERDGASGLRAHDESDGGEDVLSLG